MVKRSLLVLDTIRRHSGIVSTTVLWREAGGRLALASAYRLLDKGILQRLELDDLPYPFRCDIKRAHPRWRVFWVIDGEDPWPCFCTCIDCLSGVHCGEGNYTGGCYYYCLHD